MKRESILEKHGLDTTELKTNTLCLTSLILKLDRKLEMLRAEFPQIDPPGIYDERHCCTFNLSKDRKRMHEILNS